MASERRRIIKQLPAVNQTGTLSRFFESTVDHLFQPHQSDLISGYIGRRPAYTDPERDFYVEQTSATRRAYSLEPCMVTTEPRENSIEGVIFYEDLLNHLRFQGGLIDNHNRLFSGDYYSWCPPINYDCLINPQFYYWMPEGPPAITLLSPTNMDFDYVGATESDIIYRGRYRLFDDDSDSFRDGQIEPLRLTSGMRITPTNDVNWTSYNGKSFIVEGIGRSLILVPDEIEENLSSWDAAGWDEYGFGGYDDTLYVQPDYIVMERGATDENGWSLGNRWFHEDVVPVSLRGTSNAARATRPIIEFMRNLELYNYGDNRLAEVDIKEDLLTYEDIVGFPATDETLRHYGYTELILDAPHGVVRSGDGFNSGAGVMIHDGMTILLANTMSAYANRIYRVSGIEHSGAVILTAVAVGNFGDASTGDIVDVRLGENGGKSFVFSGTEWSAVQLKTQVQQDPLFRLYDSEGVALDDDGRYPNSDFTGNRIFGFASSSSSPLDTVLRRRLKYQEGAGLKSDIVFSNDLVTSSYKALDTVIGGYSFYNVKDDGLGNAWTLAPRQTRQYVVQTEFARNGQAEFVIPFDFHFVREIEELDIVSTEHVDIIEGNPLIIDGITVTVGMRIGLFDQNDVSDNDIYIAYADDEIIGLDPMNVPRSRGDFVSVTSGSHRDTKWYLDADYAGSGQQWRQLDGRYPFATPIEVKLNSEPQILGSDYIVEDGMVVFTSALAKNDVVQIRTYRPTARDRDVGAYEVPLNLESNPNNEEVTEITHAEFYDHFVSLIANQERFTGSAVSRNNYRDTRRDGGLGEYIVQHRASLLKTMLLAANRNLDAMLAMRYSEHEYVRYRNKFMRKIREIYNNELTTPAVPVLVDKAIDELALGRTSQFPFAYSDMAKGGQQYLTNTVSVETTPAVTSYFVPDYTAQMLDEALIYLVLNNDYKLLIKTIDYQVDADTDAIELSAAPSVGATIVVRSYDSVAYTFIPPSPTRLGLYPLYEPQRITDHTLINTRDFIIAHDGSYIDVVSDDLDVLNLAVMELERRIYAATVASLGKETALPFDRFDYIGGKYRRANDFDSIAGDKRSSERASYEYSEWIDTLSPMFERWAAFAGIDYRDNRTYSPTEPFTWNYRGITARDGEALPGHWRGIYQKYFDTDRPHSHPWEMLGFSEQPDWWIEQYGDAPYTRGNTLLWEDIADGIIRSGPRAGRYAKFSRPGVLDVLPVDEFGNLLDPMRAGIAQHRPNEIEARRPWVFGDHGPAETTWRRSPSFPFAVIQASYLLKPASFVERGWDVVRNVHVGDQWVNSDYGRRPAHKDYLVHGEDVNGSIYRAIGLQQIISDYVQSRGQSVTTMFGDAVRGLDVRLGHKTNGFIDMSSLSLRADNIGFLPKENARQILYRSPSVVEYAYSGVMIEWTGRSWRVVGYDSIRPYFDTIPPNINGRRARVSVGGDAEPQSSNWLPNVSYAAGTIVRYQNQRFTARVPHVSEAAFDISKWTNLHVATNQGATVVYYNEANVGGKIRRVPYNTELYSRQEVFDFLIAYGRFLVSQGWEFQQQDYNNNETVDWLSAGKDFLFWTLTQWQPGSAISLSPSATELKFNITHGEVQPIEQVIQGVYSLLDKDGSIIVPENTTVMRMENAVTVTPNEASVRFYMARLFIAEIEHVLVFDNRTIFDDLIYSPLLGVRQPRLKLTVHRSADWNGRIDAPGFIVSPLSDNGMFANFEKSVNDFQRLYNIENAIEDETMIDHARHLIGYQRRNYLHDLFLDPTVQFQFYQGMIRDKGTRNVMRTLLRSFFVSEAEEVKFYEEWLFRLGNYGGLTNRLSFEFAIKQHDIKGNPFMVEFTAFDPELSDNPSDDIINLPIPVANSERDPRWIILPHPDTKGHPFATVEYGRHLDGVQPWRIDHEGYAAFSIVRFDGRVFRATADVPPVTPLATAYLTFDAEIAQGLWLVDNDQPNWLPTSGYVKVDEVDYHALDWADATLVMTERLRDTAFTAGELVHVYDTGNGDWNVFRVSRIANGVHALDTIAQGETTRLRGDADFTVQVGDHILINQIQTSDVPDPAGVFEVSSLDTETPTEIILATDSINTSRYDEENPPEVFVLHPLRLPHWQQIAAYPAPAGGWTNGDLLFVDSGYTASRPTPGRWTTVVREGSSWSILRNEGERIDSNRMINGVIYDEISNRSQTSLTVYDPIKGLVPGEADKEIWYKLEYDPAKYTHGDPLFHQIDEDQAWGSKQVGRLWWDLSSTRYIDYEIGDNRYRRSVWGYLAPRSSMDVYEWVRSPIPPTSWGSFVEQADESLYADREFSGEAKDDDNPGWVERLEYSLERDAYVTHYYFWVKNVVKIPDVNFRKITAAEVAGILSNMRNSGISYFAPIATNALIVGNSDHVVNDADTIVQINYRRTDNEDNIHRHWMLAREGDESSIVDDILWKKLRDSLVGFNSMGESVPDTRLSPTERYGSEFRPRQSWFTETEMGGNTIASRLARQVFVDKLNSLLRTKPVVAETENWSDGLNGSLEPNLRATTVPPIATDAGASLTTVRLASIGPVTLDGHSPIGLIDGGLLRIGDRVLMLHQTDAAENGIYVWTDEEKFERAEDGDDLGDFIIGAVVLILEGQTRRGQRWVLTQTPTNLGDDPIRYQQSVGAFEYHREVETFSERDSLLEDPDTAPEVGEQILVRRYGSSDWWSLWRYGGEAQWRLVSIERYRTAEFWDLTDWYAEGYSSRDVPRYVFTSEMERDQQAENFSAGDLIELRRTEVSRYVYTDDGHYDLVARSNGTVQLKTALYENSAVVTRHENVDDTNLDDFMTRVAVRDGSEELHEIVNVIFSQETLLTAEESNLLFFTMVHFAHSRNVLVDWAVKSSYMIIKGINEPLERTPFLPPDITPSFLSFVNEVKPYHTKIRDFTISYYAPMDTASFRATDFDKPVYPNNHLVENETIDVRWYQNQTLAIAPPYSEESFTESDDHRDWWENVNNRVVNERLPRTINVSGEDGDFNILYFESYDSVGEFFQLQPAEWLVSNSITVMVHRDLDRDRYGLILFSTAVVELIVTNLGENATLLENEDSDATQLAPGEPISATVASNTGFAIDDIGKVFTLDLVATSVGSAQYWRFLDPDGDFYLPSDNSIAMRREIDSTSEPDPYPIRHGTISLFFDRISYIDWRTEGSEEFLDLYSQHYLTNRTWRQDRAVIPGHWVMSLNHDDLSLGHWRLFQLIRPNPIPTRISEIVFYEDETVIVTRIPHNIPTTSVVGWDNEQGWEGTAWDAGSEILPVHIVIAQPIYDGDEQILFGTYFIKDAYLANNRITIAHNDANRIGEILNLTDPLSAEIYIYKPVYLQFEDKTIAVTNHAMDERLLNEAERLALYYNPLEGMPSYDNRQLMNADFKGTRVDGVTRDGEGCQRPPFMATYHLQSSTQFGVDPLRYVLPFYSGWDPDTLGWGCIYDGHLDPTTYTVRVSLNGQPIPQSYFDIISEPIVLMGRYDPFERTPHNWTYDIEYVEEGVYRLPITLTAIPTVYYRRYGEQTLTSTTSFTLQDEFLMLNVALRRRDAVFVIFDGTDVSKLRLDASIFDIANQGDLIAIEVIPIGEDTERDSLISGGTFTSPAATVDNRAITIEGGLRLPGPIEMHISDGASAEIVLINSPYLGVIEGVSHNLGYPTPTQHVGFASYIYVYYNGVRQPHSSYSLAYDEVAATWKLNLVSVPEAGTEIEVQFLGKPAGRNPLYEEGRPEELIGLALSESIIINTYQRFAGGRPTVGRTVHVAE